MVDFGTINFCTKSYYNNYMYLMCMQDEEGGEPSKKVKGHPEKRLRNQFNFSDRASQTLNNPYRVSSHASAACTCTCACTFQSGLFVCQSP